MPGIVSWVLGLVCWVLGFVSWVLGIVCWVLGIVCWVLRIVVWVSGFVFSVSRTNTIFTPRRLQGGFPSCDQVSLTTLPGMLRKQPSLHGLAREEWCLLDYGSPKINKRYSKISKK